MLRQRPAWQADWMPFFLARARVFSPTSELVYFFFCALLSGAPINQRTSKTEQIMCTRSPRRGRPLVSQQRPPLSLDELPCDVLQLLTDHVTTHDLACLARTHKRMHGAVARQERFARMVELHCALAGVWRTVQLAWSSGNLQHVSLCGRAGVLSLVEAQLLSLIAVPALSLTRVDLRSASFSLGSPVCLALETTTQLASLHMTACYLPAGGLDAIACAAARGGAVRDLALDLCGGKVDRLDRSAHCSAAAAGHGLPIALRMGAFSRLSLRDAGLLPDACRAIADALSGSVALTSLDLSNNTLSNLYVVHALGRALACSNLQILCLSGCGMRGEECTVLADYLYEHDTTLHTLDLGFNCLGPRFGIFALCRTVRRPRSIRNLLLRANSISADSIEHVVRAVVRVAEMAQRSSGTACLSSIDLRMQRGAIPCVMERLQSLADVQHRTRVFVFDS